MFALTSFRGRSLSAASQAGLVNNLNDGPARGLFPVLFISSGLSLNQAGIPAAVHPAVRGAGQLVARMLIQYAGLVIVATADSFQPWFIAAILLELGTAMVYPAPWEFTAVA
ncbi:hypothetical protein [Arthrobacter sp. NPDC092385]|uniref:hypothetical protein n=1 Tax=Arthrobacter sp. NPDC092385 TaxID=3363943 RepID=UPI00382CC43E